MRNYSLERVQFLPISQEDAWAFFSSPGNLEEITPPDMKFEIIDLPAGKMYAGMLIRYRVRPLWGIPMTWVTRIGEVNAPEKFTDTQLRGPYKRWEHTHIFETVAGGVKMTDQVMYSLHLGLLGRVAHALFVKKRLQSIFDFRKQKLIQLLGTF